MTRPPRGVILDIDGTLVSDGAALPGALDTVLLLEDRGIPFRLMTNSTRRSRRGLTAELQRLGFPVEDDDLFTAPAAAADWLRGAGLRRIAVYLPEPGRRDLDAFEIDDDDPEAVLVGDLAEAWDFDTLNRAFRQLVGGARLVALQRNRYWRVQGALQMDAGPFVAALEYAAGVDAVVVGKPSPSYFHMACRAMELEPSDVAVVGDDVEADVAGARAAGLIGILVRTGKYDAGRVAALGSGADATLDSIADLPDLLAGA